MPSPRAPLRRRLRLLRLILSSGAGFLREGPRTLFGRCPQIRCLYQRDAGDCVSVPRGVALRLYWRGGTAGVWISHLIPCQKPKG